jgi:hypothetical protein
MFQVLSKDTQAHKADTGFLKRKTNITDLRKEVRIY